LSRRRSDRQLRQPVLLGARGLTRSRIFLGQFHCLIGVLHRFRILVLHVECHRQAEDRNRIRLLRKRFNRLAQIGLCVRPCFGIERNRAQNRISLGTQKALESFDLFRRIARRRQVGVDRYQSAFFLASASR